MSGVEAVQVGNLHWFCHHEWTEGKSTHIDGFLMPGNVQLDIIAAGDLEVGPHDDAMSEIAWMNGNVHINHDDYGCLTQVVPNSRLTSEAVTEALGRFRP